MVHDDAGHVHGKDAISDSLVFEGQVVVQFMSKSVPYFPNLI